MTFDKRPPILRDFSGAGKGELRTLLDRPMDEFRTSQRIHPDGTEDTAKTRGFLDTEVRRRRKGGKEPEEFPFYGVPISNTALYGFKSDDTPMSPPAYWGESGTGEVERGGALIYVGGRTDTGRVKKNKTWVTKPASGGYQAHPGNCWWEDDRIENPNKRKRVSWWGPFGPVVDRSTTFNAKVAELGLAPLTWHKISGTPDQLVFEYNYLGAPVQQGLVFVDGVLELTLNRSIVAAAFYYDAEDKKYLRFLAMSNDYPHDYTDGNISNLQLCSYSYETDTVTEGIWIGDAFLRADLTQYRPKFNASGTKFLYEGTADPAGWCEVDFATQDVVYEAQLFPYAQNTIDTGYGWMVAPAALEDALNARAEAINFCPPAGSNYYPVCSSQCSLRHVWYEKDVVHAMHAIDISGSCSTYEPNLVSGTRVVRSASVGYYALSIDGVVRHRTQKLRSRSNDSWVYVNVGGNNEITETRTAEYWSWAAVTGIPLDDNLYGFWQTEGGDGKHCNVISASGGLEHDESYAHHFIFTATETQINYEPNIVIPHASGELYFERTYLSILKENDGELNSELCQLPINEEALLHRYYVATNRKETDFVLSSGFEYDPEGYQSAAVKASYLLWLDKKREWHNLKGRIETGDATSDETVRVVSLIAVDKDRGYYEDDFFTS